MNISKTIAAIIVLVSRLSAAANPVTDLTGNIGSFSTNRNLYSDTWVATDALGRELSGYDECGPKRNDRFVGAFYWLWHCANGGGSSGPYDISQRIAANPANPQWGRQYSYHHWGQPELGYYDSADPYVLRKHASLLSDAGVDVIFFDTTNSPFTWQNKYMALCAEFSQIRSEGGQTPKIAFMAPFGDPGTVVQSLYDNLYAPGLYSDLWFQWDGKPLIMANRGWFSNTSDIYNFFTFRTPVASYFTGPTGSNQWGWLEVYPQHAFYDAGGSLEQVTVGVAQNAMTTSNGSTGTFMSHKNGAMGRSWHNGSKEPGADAANYGYNFAEQWQRALSLDPEFVFITGWNEWIAMRLLEWAGYTAANNSYYANAMFVDQYNWEYSRDVEPMVGGHTDNYYYQMIDNIRKYKGVSQLPPAEDPAAMAIDGNFGDWDVINLIYCDTYNDTVHRSHSGYGSTYYTNTTGRNDIMESKVAFDAYKVYFYVETADALTPHTDSNWMLLFINADQDNGTGWEGYDYVINRYRTGTTAVLEKSVGGWNWEFVDYVSYAYSGNQMELSVPRSLIGQNNRKDIGFDFHWADNIQNENDITEFSVSGDSAPNRRFNYRYEKKNTPATYFEQDGNFESWAMTNKLTNGVVADGVLRCDITGFDCYMVNGTPYSVDSQIYKYVHIRMKNQSSSSFAQIYWTTSVSTGWNDAKHKDFSVYPNDIGFRDYWIDMSGHACWNGTIRLFRLDPSAATSGHIEIDFIRLQDRMPVCGDLGYKTPDLNHNCIINYPDLAMMAQQWLNGAAGYTIEDTNRDHTINQLDLIMMAENWLIDIIGTEYIDCF